MELKDLTIGGMSCFEEIEKDLNSVEIIEDHIIAITSKTSHDIYIAKDTGNSYFTLLNIEPMISKDDHEEFFSQTEDEFAEYCKHWL